MGIDLDLSAFRLVKSFAAVEISKNVGTSGSDDVAAEPQADTVRPRDAAVSAPAVQPGLSAAAGNAAPPAVDQIPERLDDDMRASLDQRLEGAEREAVSWQYGQRSAALSLAGLARPGGSPASRQGWNSASGQAAAREPDLADDAAPTRTPIATPNVESAPAQTDLVQAKQPASEQGSASSATAALPLAKTSSQPSIMTDELTGVIPDNDATADASAAAAVPSDPLRTDAGLEKPQLLLASTIALFGEAQAVEALQSMVYIQGENEPTAAASDRTPGKSETVSLSTADELAVQNAVLRDLVRLSLPAVGGPALEAEQAQVPYGRSGDEEPLADPQRLVARSSTQTNIASRTLASTALDPELPGALPLQLSERDESKAISGGGAEQLKAVEQGLVSDGKPPELAGIGPDGKAAMAGPGVKMLEILDVLMSLSVSAGEGSEDWQSLSSVILNAAMIPGWPPPRQVENPAAVKRPDLLMQLSQSADAEEAPMTPEQLLAYLVSIGANVRLLRALQELVSRVEKKSGPALLAWLAGLVSALKVIEKSLKDIVEDGMELPEWLAELADAAKRRKRRKQFQI